MFGKLLPLQTTLFEGNIRFALGETVIVNCFVLPVHEVAPTK